MISARFALVFSTYRVSAPSLYLRVGHSGLWPLSVQAIGIRHHVLVVRGTMRHGA